MREKVQGKRFLFLCALLQTGETIETLASHCRAWLACFGTAHSNAIMQHTVIFFVGNPHLPAGAHNLYLAELDPSVNGPGGDAECVCELVGTMVDGHGNS